MSVPFVQAVRTRRDPIHVGSPDGVAMHLRVELPELWETVQVIAPASASVLQVKAAALHELMPNASEGQFVMKLRGFEVLDEGLSLEQVGARDGSIFLLTNRRRRPVR